MKIAAVILAAGASSRFGRPKQLVRLDEEPLVRRTARIALEAGCALVVVVVNDELSVDLDGIELVMNPNWREGIASSIRIGIERVKDADAAILLACDQPLVRRETLLDLIALHQRSRKPIVASAYANTLGIPAFFLRSCFPGLIALHGDHGAKKIILARQNEVASYEFADGAIDLDTPEDLENYLRRNRLRTD